MSDLREQLEAETAAELKAIDDYGPGGHIRAARGNERRDCVAPSSHAEPGVGNPADEPYDAASGQSPSPSSPPEQKLGRTQREEDAAWGADTEIDRAPPSPAPSTEERERDGLRAELEALGRKGEELAEVARLRARVTELEGALEETADALESRCIHHEDRANKAERLLGAAEDLLCAAEDRVSELEKAARRSEQMLTAIFEERETPLSFEWGGLLRDLRALLSDTEGGSE